MNDIHNLPIAARSCKPLLSIRSPRYPLKSAWVRAASCSPTMALLSLRNS